MRSPIGLIRWVPLRTSSPNIQPIAGQSFAGTTLFCSSSANSFLARSAVEDSPLR